MIQPFSLSIAQLFQFGLGACLLFVGLSLCFRRPGKCRFFAATNLLLAFTLIIEVVFPIDLIQVLLLSIWPTFLLSIQERTFGSRVRWIQLFHYALPMTWLTLIVCDVQRIHVWFHSVAFVQLIPYMILCSVAMFRQVLSERYQRYFTPLFLGWACYGYLMLMLIRLILPVFMTDPAALAGVFHGLIGVYFLSVASFYFRDPHQYPDLDMPLEKEEGTNYEEEIRRRLEELLLQKKVYLIPDLTLQELSVRMHMRSAELSGFFNATMGRNFNDVINAYRVDEVKRLIGDPKTDPKATIMELAYQAGFNSKATFNRIFKQVTGVTPKAYRGRFS